MAQIGAYARLDPPRVVGTELVELLGGTSMLRAPMMFCVLSQREIEMRHPDVNEFIYRRMLVDIATRNNGSELLHVAS